MNINEELRKCIDCGSSKSLIDYDKEVVKSGAVKYRKYCKCCRKIRRKASLEKRRIIVTHKVCSKCANKKPASTFHKNANVKDGLNEVCKKCVKLAHSKRVNQPILEGTKTCSSCQENKDVSEFHRRKASFDGLNAKCKTCQLIANYSYPVDRTKANKASAKYKKKVKREVFKLLGGKCNKCGFHDHRALHVDHINANHGQPQGSHRRSGSGLYVAIRNKEFPLTDFQLLCANCNWVKRYENGEITSPPTKDQKFKDVVDPAFERIRNSPVLIEKRRATSKKECERLRNFILDLYGNKCNHCGYNTDPRALQVDHIDHSKITEGRKDSKRAGAGLYRAIKSGKKDKKDFQLLCVNCNWVKRYTNKECQRKKLPNIAS